MYRIVPVCAVLISLVLFLPVPGLSTPTVTQDLAFIDNRPSDDIFGFSGLRLNLTITATDTGGSGALTGPGSGVTAVSSNPGFSVLFSQPVNVPLNAVFPIIGGAEFTRLLPLNNGIGDFPNVTGTYTFTVTNTSSESISSTSHDLDKLEIIPLPTNLAFSDQTTTPVFTFSDPDPTPDLADLFRRYQVHIFDDTKTNIFLSAFQVTPSFTVPSGILEEGRTYYFRAISMDFDQLEPGGLHSRLENRAMAYAPFQSASVPEPGGLLLLASALIGLGAYGRRKFFNK